VERFDILPGFLKKEGKEKKHFHPFLLVVIKSEWGAVFARSREPGGLLVTHVVQRTDKAWLGDGCRHLSGLSKCSGYHSPLVLPACSLDIQTGLPGKPHCAVLHIWMVATMSCQQFQEHLPAPLHFHTCSQLCLSPVSEETNHWQQANPLGPSYLPVEWALAQELDTRS